MLKVLAVFGTRPEAIKLAPVIRELRQRSGGTRLQTIVCVNTPDRHLSGQILARCPVLLRHFNWLHI